MALGMQDNIPFPARRVQFAPGDRLFLFTDGLTDAVAPDGSPFGEPRLDAAAERLRLPFGGGTVAPGVAGNDGENE